MLFNENQLFLSLLVFVVGACLGSFSNVVALRYVRAKDWIKAPSTCFACGQNLTVGQNLPVWGWLRQGGKSACCQQKLPLRYLWVELFGGAWALMAVAYMGLSLSLVFSLFFILNMVIFLTDFERFLIPDFASIGGIFTGLGFALFEFDGLPGIREACVGGIFGFGLLYGINFFYRLWRGHDGLGFGDVKLMALYGVWLGPVAVLPILFFSSFFGAFVGIFLIMLNKTPLMKTKHGAVSVLPYGCFLVPVGMFWGMFGVLMPLPIILISG